MTGIDVYLSTEAFKRLLFCFFFFKQKTAYEISACLVGSEMCIRDSSELDQLACFDLVLMWRIGNKPELKSILGI